MYYLKFLAYPRPGHPEHGVISGAFVHCWINEAVQGAAKMVAIGILEQQGWEIEALESAVQVTPDDYADDDTSRKHAERASIDGMSFSFQSWTSDARARGELGEGTHPPL